MNGLVNKRGAAVHQPLIMTPLVVENKGTITTSKIKLQSEEIKELKRKLYEQQQLHSRDEKIRILKSNVQIMRQ